MTERSQLHRTGGGVFVETRLILWGGAVATAMAWGTLPLHAAEPGAAAAPAADEVRPKLDLRPVTVTGKRSSPVPGSTLTREEIPSNVQSISAEQIKAAHALSLTDLMNSELQSVNVNDYQGNPFQMDVTYRGFTASPQLGTSQGLSVFLDGIRVNEPFGDVVNWDLLPMNALAGLDVFPGSNPVFGLGTLGGAIALRTKNGFDQPGVEAEVLAGSFGRKQLQVSAGGSHGNVAGFVAANLFDEKGWRNNSPSAVNQVFGKLSYREGRVNLDGSTFYVNNRLVGNGLVPTEMVEADRAGVFSSPDKTKNELLQFQLAGALQASDVFSVTGQVYRRRSDRTSSSGDVNDNLGGAATRRAKPGESPVCAFADANKDGIVDYNVVTRNLPDGFGGFTSRYDLAFNSALSNGASQSDAEVAARATLDPSTFNQALPPEVARYIRNETATDSHYYPSFGPGGVGGPELPTTPEGGTLINYRVPAYSATENTYMGADGIQRLLVTTPALNRPCGVSQLVNKRFQYAIDDARTPRDGARQPATDADGNPVRQAGVVEGTPTSIISEGAIRQLTHGGSMQLNWNLPQHKLLIGASIDNAASDYANCAKLGLFDDNRRAYLDPEAIGEEFTAATQCVRNNDFGGSSLTRSLYLSETYSPLETLHFSASARYNHTRVTNKLKVRAANSDVELADYQNSYARFALCPGGNLADCDPDVLNKMEIFDVNGFAFNSDPNAQNVAGQTTEVFRYRSLNPSVGATWQAREDLNVYAGWSQGSRTPSVIELGCAFDRTPVRLQFGQLVPKSLIDPSSCNLPNSLSGDPHLKQITSRTTELGLRGAFSEGLTWNFTAYRSNVLDDIYLVGFSPTRSFFDTIPKTRRQGLEMGIAGTNGKLDYKLNYSLTEATIQSNSLLVSPYNSTSGTNEVHADYKQIVVKPGDRLAGVPLHNLNLSLGYEVTDRWHIGLKAVAHSSAYVRGNENNLHEPGVQRPILTDLPDPNDPYGHIENQPTGRYTPSTQRPGKTAGFMVFNLKTSYRFDNGVSLLFLVNNLFNRDYYSAGRLGLNPFSPSVQGAIASGGFNVNSNEWSASNFVAPGAPRAAWIALSYELE